MYSLSTLEVNSFGQVITVSSPTSSLLNGLLPPIAGNITTHFDEPTNEMLKGRLKTIFNSNLGNEFTLVINNLPLQCTAHHYLDDRAFLYFKLIEQRTSENLQDIINKKNEASRLKLLDFPFQDSSIPILYVYRDGSLYDFNEAFCNLFGYDVDDAKTFNLSNWNQAYYPDTWEQTWEKLKIQGVISFSSKRSKRDGKVIDVEIRAHYIKFGDLELNCATITDVTERKKEELKLKLADFSFKNVFSPITFIREDGSIFYYNEAIATLLGYTVSEFEKLTIFDILNSYNNEQWQERWNNVTQNIRLTLNTRLQKKDGSWIDAEIRTNRINFGEEDLNCSFYTDNTEKKKMETKLEMVEFSFRQSETAIVYLKENGQLIDYNEAYIQLLGYEKEDLENLNSFDLNLDFDGGFWEENWMTLREKRIISFCTTRKKKDGSIMELELRVNMLNHNDLEICCAYITDITARKRIDEQLNVVNFTFQNASIANLLIKSDGTLYDFNLASLKMFGYTREEMQELQIIDLAPTATSNVRKEIWDSIRISGTLVHHKSMRTKDGTWMDIELRSNRIVKGDLELNCAFLIDITEKKKQEERLKLLEKVVTETNQSILIADATEGMDTPIIYANNAFTNISGYTLAEVIGQNPRLLHKDMEVGDDEGRNIMRNAIKNCIPWRVEVLNTNKNGKHYWADIAGFPVYDKTLEKYSHWVAIKSDITKRKEAEAEREQLMNELIENNKELKEFSYITTHNLRAPLTNLLSICRLLDPDKFTDNRTLKLIEGFKSSTYHLNDTLNDLITILIIKENKNIPTDQLYFQTILDKVKQFLSIQLFDEKVVIETEFNVATIDFTNVYLESIFLNLLTNSIRFKHPKRSPIIKISTTKTEDGKTQLTFSDNGIGMNMGMVKDKIFGMYQRFHDNTDGKGIGLYLLHSQITALGGKIEVNSKEEVGTVFTITFR